jgi:thioredoxin 1
MGSCCCKSKKGDSDKESDENRRGSDNKHPGELYLVKDRHDFEKVLNSTGKKLLVVDFFAPWCGPCKMVAPMLEELSAEIPDVKFVKVDMDQNEEVATEYGVSCMPTFLLFKEGDKVAEFAGPNIEKLKEIIGLHNRDTPL